MKRVIAWMLSCVILLSTAPLEAIAAAPEEEPSTSAAQETTDLQETAGTIVQITDDEQPDEESIPTSSTQVKPQPPTENTEVVEEAVEQDTQTQAEELVSLQSTTTEFTYTVLNGTYCKVTGYSGTDAEITIPSEIDGYIVQQIADSVFKNNTTLEKVVFPETLESVGSYVFSGCTSLTDVGLNTGLTNIGSYMFQNCTALTEITIPGSVTTVGSYAFSGCTGLSEVNLSEGLTTINSYAFQNCTALESIRFPASVTTLSGRAFYNCTSLSSITYPVGWTTTPDYVYNSTTVYSDSSSPYTSPFAGCTGLTGVTVPEGVTAIPEHAFQGCASLETIVLPDSLTKLLVTFDTNRTKQAILIAAVYQGGRMLNAASRTVTLAAGQFELPISVQEGQKCKVCLLDGTTYSPLTAGTEL